MIAGFASAVCRINKTEAGADFEFDTKITFTCLMELQQFRAN